MKNVLVTGCKGGSDHSLQSFRQVSSVFLASPGKAGQLFQLGQTYCRLNLGHSEIVTNALVIVALPLAVAADQTQPVGDSVVVGGYDASLGSSDILGRVE